MNTVRKVKKAKVNTPKPNEAIVQLGLDCRRYVELKAQLAELEKEKKELDKYIKKAITTRGSAVTVKDPERPDVSYMVKISEVATTRLDTELVKRILDDEQIELCSKTSTSERMSIEELDSGKEVI